MVDFSVDHTLCTITYYYYHVLFTKRDDRSGTGLSFELFYWTRSRNVGPFGNVFFIFSAFRLIIFCPCSDSRLSRVNSIKVQI